MQDYTTEIKIAKKSRVARIVLAAVLLIIIFFLLLLTIVFPLLLLVDIVLIIYEVKIMKNIKKLKQQITNMQNRQKELQKYCLEKGYEKICEDFYLSEKEQKVIIEGKEYGFSQVIDCNLTEEIYSQFYQSDSSIQQTKMCKKIIINVTIDDFERPHIKLVFSCHANVISPQYIDTKQLAQNALSTLKIIISKNNENFIESGTVTKIEHRHINEKSADELLEKLNELYQNGILTDYEFAMKKAELLDKLK